MSPRSVQAPGAVVIIRPHHFSPNTQTASDNACQRDATALDAAALGCGRIPRRPVFGLLRYESAP